MKPKKFIFLVILSLIFFLTLSYSAIAQVSEVSDESRITYTVQPGDTLYKIAQTYNTTVAELVRLNQITNPGLIYPGQIIVISGGSEPGSYSEYVVQPGDTLYRLAIKFNTTVAKLAELNKIANPSLISVGQLLIVPAPDNGSSPTFNYLVQPGDTLYKLAARFGTTVAEIVRLNKIVNPNLIEVGQVLIIPGTHNPAPASKVVYRGNSNRKQVALTFDAGAGAEYTPQLLTILKNYNLKPTVFLTGRWIENFPQLAKQIAASGYEIGNHSYSHPYLTQISDQKAKEEIMKAEGLITGLGVKRPNLFRPPYGARNSHSDNLVNSLGYTSVMWSLDTVDWKNPGPQAIITKIKNNIKNGDIVLMHLNAPDTVKALPEVITWLRNQGYQLVTVSAVLQ